MAHRVLFVSHQSGLRHGGAILNLIRTVERLDRNLFQPVVAVPQGGTLAQELRQRNIPVLIFPMQHLSRRPVNIIRILRDSMVTIPRLSLALRREKISLVHVNSLWNIYGAPAAKLAGIPAVWHIREMPAMGLSTRLLHFWVRAWADWTICISKAVARDWSHGQGKSSKLAVIYDGIDAKGYGETIGFPLQSMQERLDLPLDSAWVIGTVGSLTWRKGVDIFLQAAARVLQQDGSGAFVIAGSGMLEEELKRLSRQVGVNAKVRFLGHISENEMARLYRVLDIFALASFNEPYGMVLLEAMACGKPVVATKVGGIPEIVVDSETGLLVPPKDPEALSEAMLTLLRNPDLCRRMGDAGRRRVKQNFTWDRTMAQLQGLYAELLQ